MAIWLYRHIRDSIREHSDKKAVPTTDDAHLVPEHSQHHDSCQGEPNGITASKNLSSSAQAQQNESDRKKKSKQWKLLLGLLLPNFLAAVDVTIVAPAIPLISSHFDQLSGGFNWIVAAYTLTFTTFVPASGQFAEVFGRHFALQFQMFWILVGSALCAGAQSWIMLLVGRALQGLGAAGIMNLSRIILSDGATLAESSRNISVLSLIGGLSYGVGPVMGGYLADLNWRYCFVFPTGLAALAHILVFFLMRKVLVKGQASRNAASSPWSRYMTGLGSIDWIGMILFIFGVGLVILAIQWGGTQYAWDSAVTIAPFVVGGLLCVAFFGHEYLLGPGRFTSRLLPKQVPVIPSTLFRKKDVSLLLIINFSAGISLMCAFYFISYYFQLAEGYSSSKAGLQLLYYTPGLGVGVYSAMYMCNVWPAQTFYPLFIGSIVEAAGLSALAYSVSIRNITLVKVFLAISGGGTGLRFMPIVLHAAGIWSTRIPAIQSLLSFMLPLGETIGISIMGAVFSNKLNLFLSRITNLSGDGFTGGLPSLAAINSLPPALKGEVQNAAARSVMWAIIVVLPFVGLSILASAFLGNVWIGGIAKKNRDGHRTEEAVEGHVLYESFVWAFFTGSIKANKQELDINREQEAARMKMEDVEKNHPTQPQSAFFAGSRRN